MNPAFRAARWVVGAVFALGAGCYTGWRATGADGFVLAGIVIAYALPVASLFVLGACWVGSDRARAAGVGVVAVVLANLRVLLALVVTWCCAAYGALVVLHDATTFRVEFLNEGSEPWVAGALRGAGVDVVAPTIAAGDRVQIDVHFGEEGLLQLEPPGGAALDVSYGCGGLGGRVVVVRARDGKLSVQVPPVSR